MTRQRITLGVLSMLLLFAAHTAFFSGYVTDDAFISFRYLDHWLAGDGLVFNTGEWVWGFSNFLWIALLAPPVALGADPVFAARIAGVAANLGVVVLVLHGPHLGGERRWNPLGALLLAGNGAFVLQGPSGLETSFFTLLLLATLRFLERSATREEGGALSGIAAGSCMALAALTRPEGGLFAAALLAAPFVGSRAWVRSAGLSLAVLVPVLAVFLAVMEGYYDSLWPNALDARIGMSVDSLARGGHYLVQMLLAYPIHSALLAIGVVRFRSAPLYERMATGLGAFMLVFYVAAGGGWMPGYRLFHPAFALACVLVPLTWDGLRRAVERMLGGPGFVRHVMAGLGSIALLATLAATPLDPHVREAAGRSDVDEGIEVGQWMKENLPPDTWIATNTVGAIPYYSDLPVIDMTGVTDRTIAERDREQLGSWKGIDKGDGDYVLSRRPDYIQLGTSTGSTRPLLLSGVEIYRSPRFWSEYEPVTFEVDADTRLTLYKRRATPSEEPPTPEQWQTIRQTAEAAIRSSAYRY